MYRVFGSGSCSKCSGALQRVFKLFYHGQNYWSGKALKALVRYTVSLGTEEGWEITEPWTLGLLSFPGHPLLLPRPREDGWSLS